MPGAFVADPVFEANPKQVAMMIGRIHHGELALPDFQRDFVWEPRRTAELLRSIMSRYPAGNLLFWRLGGEAGSFASREIDGAPPLGGLPTELILDGQQRLTSLYQALMGVGGERYYVVLDELLDGDGESLPVSEVEWDKAVVWKDPESDAGAQAESDEWQFENACVPVALDDFDGWLDKMVRATTQNAEQEDARKAALRKVRDRYLAPLRTYSFPVTTLPETTPIEAVCTVFETLNRTGKPLGPFELLTARFYPSGTNLRDLWDEAQDAYPMLTDFNVDPYSLLQAVCLRARNSAQRSDVLGKLTAEDVDREWATVVKAAARVLDLLQANCGVLTAKYLPYSMLLVPMAAAAVDIQALPSAERATAFARLERFYWCSVFATNYDQGANSQAGADYQKLTDWLPDEEQPAPEAVGTFSLTRSALRTATVRRKVNRPGFVGGS